MAMEESLTLRLTSEELELIKKERERQAADGLRISKSQAVRYLIFRGSTVTDTAAKGRVLNTEIGKKSK